MRICGRNITFKFHAEIKYYDNNHYITINAYAFKKDSREVWKIDTIIYVRRMQTIHESCDFFSK